MEAARAAAADQALPSPDSFNRQNSYVTGNYDIGERDWNPIAGLAPDPDNPYAPVSATRDDDGKWTVTPAEAINVEVQRYAQVGLYGGSRPDGTESVGVTDIEVVRMGDSDHYRVNYKVNGQAYWSRLSDEDAAIWSGYGDYEKTRHQQDQAQQADVTGHYSPVHDLLRQQRQQQLDAAAQQQGQQQLRQPSAVGTQIGKQPADAGGRWLSSKRASKVGGGFQ